MKITHQCCCGATAKFEDSKGSYINTGGKRDEKGRLYLVEVRADEWLEMHHVCLLGNATK